MNKQEIYDKLVDRVDKLRIEKKESSFLKEYDYISHPKTKRYVLIDYENKGVPNKPVELTEVEAHSKNMGLALNGVSKRYVKE